MHWFGSLPASEACARGLAITVSFEAGAIKLSWLDTIIQVMQQGGDQFGSSLRDKFIAICPEHAQKVHWQHVTAMATRVTAESYQAVEDHMEAAGLITPPFPQTWFREPWMLLKGRKSRRDEHLTPDEQLCFVHRLLGAVSKHGAAGTGSLIRAIPESDRKGVAKLAKKYVEGMSSVEGVTIKDFMDRFARGDFDVTISTTTNPTLASRFWPWVKDFVREKALAEASSEAVKVDAMADAAIAEAVALEEEAAQERKTAEINSKGRLQDAEEQAERKCRQAFALQVQSYHQKLTVAVRETTPLADEICVLREDARNRAIDPDTQCPWLVIPMSKKSSFKDNGWVHRAASKTLAVLFDVNFCEQWGAEHVLAWLQTVESRGLVLLLGSGNGPEAPCMRRLMQLEQDVLREVNLEKTTILRVFLQWANYMQVGWVCLLCNHPTTAAAMSTSTLLHNVLSSEAVGRTGALLNLPPVDPAEQVRCADRHMLFSAQRGRAFYEAFLTGLGLVSQAALAGTADAVATLVEPDAGVGELFSLLIKHHPAQCADGPPLIWVGSTQPSSNGRSGSARHAILRDIGRTAAQAAVARQRQLKRARSETDDRLDALVEKLPTPPVLPNLLCEHAQRRHSQWVGSHSAHLGLTDGTNVIVPPVGDEPSRLPSPLLLANRCVDGGVVVAPSLFLPNEQGLFPCRRFLAGEVICLGTSAAGRWVLKTEAGPQDGRFTLEVGLVDPSLTQPKQMILMGDPNNDLWALMNSSDENHSPNVTPKITGHTTMNSDFVAFTAMVDIEPFFTELLWDYKGAALKRRCSAALEPEPLPKAAKVTAAAATQREEPDAAADAAEAEADAAADAAEAEPDAAAGAAAAADAAEAEPDAVAGAAAAAGAVEAEPPPPYTLTLAHLPAHLPAPPPTHAPTHPAAVEAKAVAGTAVDTDTVAVEAGAVAGTPDDAMAGAAAAADPTATEAPVADTAVGEEAAVEAEDATKIKESSVKVADISKPSGCLYFQEAHSRIYAIFEQPQTKLTGNKVLYTSLGGSVTVDATWRSVPYNITPKSKVFCGGDEMCRMSDCLGAAVVQVYGFKDRSMQEKATGKGGGQLSLYWSPKEKETKRCEALLRIPGVLPTFMMECKPVEGSGGALLAPSGVCFFLSKPFKCGAQGAKRTL